MFVKARCPQCGTDLLEVKQSNGMLNDEQFDAVKAGDWYCTKCPSNDRGKTTLCYWWQREVLVDDPVNPKHYDGDACMRAIATAGYAYPFCIGTAMKYLWRAGRKDGALREQDIAKASWYLDWILEDLRRHHDLGMISDVVYDMQASQVEALQRACDDATNLGFDGPAFVQAFGWKRLQDFGGPR